MKITILIYEKYTALDVVGPYEALSNISGAEIYFAGVQKGLYGDNKNFKLDVPYSIDDITESDVLLIPGGFGIDAILNDKKIINWIKKIDTTTKFTTSVCSGALLLASTGLLEGRNVTTHWNRKEQLRKYNVNVVDERYVKDGKYITSAGVSAGIDMALYLISLIQNENTAKFIQLGMEYDPQPPFDCGSPNKLPKELLEKMKPKK
jgi:transcriptional regulator GlxA family with amidase domain